MLFQTCLTSTEKKRFWESQKHKHSLEFSNFGFPQEFHRRMSVILAPQTHTVKMMTGFSFFAELYIKELFTHNWPGIGFDGFCGAYFGWSSYRGRKGWFRGSRGARCGGGGSLRQASGCNGHSFTAWALASLCSTILTAWLLTTCLLQYIHIKT